MKKQIAVLTTLAIIGCNATPISAIGSEISEFVSTDSIQCGYERIYRDTPKSTWIMDKPETPDNEQLSITFNSVQGEKYVFTLMDSLMQREVAKVESASNNTGTNNVVVDIPGDTADGIYYLIGKIGNKKETVKTVTIDGNIALKANVSSNYQFTMNNINDLTITAIEAKGNPSNNPIDIDFQLAKKSRVKKLSLFSSNIEGQGPTEIEVYYKQEGEYKKAEKYSNLTWESYVNGSNENTNTGKPRKRAIVNLPTTVETDSIRIKVLKGNTKWGKIVFDDIMIWGHEISENYKISIAQNLGTANKENIISITGNSSGELLNAKINIQFLQGEKVLKEGSSSFKDGVLNTSISTPSNINGGLYTIKITGEGIEKSFDYQVKSEITYETNIDENISAYTSNYKEFKYLDTINDNNYDNSHTTNSVKLWTKDVETDEQFIVREVKIYAPKNSFNSVEMKVGTQKNTNSAFTNALNYNELEWMEDENGSYVELYSGYNFLSYGYELVFNTSVDIKEIDVTGVYFKNNLFKSAEIKFDDKKIESTPLIDNSNLTKTSFNKNGVIEISSNNGKAYELDNLFITTDKSKNNGIKNIEVSYWQDGKWAIADVDVKPMYTDTENKTEALAINLPHIKTNKIKLNTAFTSNNTSIYEINSTGTEINSATAMAEILEIDELTSGSTKLRFNCLDKINKNWAEDFDIAIISSSDVNMISLDGTVNHAKEEKTISVKFEVTNKDTGEKSLTREYDVVVPKALSNNKVLADIQIDSTTAYKNPAMGWVAYVEGFECAVHERFKNGESNEITNWNARNKGMCVEVGTDAASAREYTTQMDKLIAEGMPCNILYIREPWSWFEPEEGQYAWEDENSACHELITWARKNGIQLAFRVLTCSSACAQQATPQWVFDEGASIAKRNHSHDYVVANEPYLDDKIFVNKFDNFVGAMAKEFDNENTAFLDAHGHGQWGEMNGMMWSKSDMNSTVENLQNIYDKHFKNVLLGGQLMSSKGNSTIMKSFEVDGPNFVMRRDAYGSDRYLNGHKDEIKKFRDQGVPMFAENCYHHFDSRNFRWSNNIAYSSGRVNEYGGDNPFNTMRDMMNKVISDAITTGANSLDLRTLEDAKLWMENKDYLDKWTQEGGYRISISNAIFTKELKHGEEINVESSWVNNGVGIVPNNNKRWDKKMKVAYAIIDENGKIVQRQVISTDEINVGDFEKDNTYKYNTLFKVDENLPEGKYKLAVSILNEKDNLKIGIQLANKGEITNDGWLTLGDLQIKDEFTDLSVISDHGKVEFDKDLTIGNSATMTVIPDKDYKVSSVLINDKEIKLDTENKYKIEELPEKLNIKVIYEKISKKPVVNISIKGKGNAEFIDDPIVGQSGTMQFTPDNDYYLSYVMINGQRVNLEDNKYYFDKIPEELNIEVEFVKNSTNSTNDKTDSKTDNKVYTGDNAPVFGIGMLMALSLSAITALRKRKKTR